MRSWGRGCAFEIDVMAKADVEKLIQYSKEHDNSKKFSFFLGIVLT